MSTNGIHLGSMTLPFALAGFWQPHPDQQWSHREGSDGFHADARGSRLAGLSIYIIGHRPIWGNTKETLSHLFGDDTLLASMNPETRAAAAKFKASIDGFQLPSSCSHF
jgi:hypothetical protein